MILVALALALFFWDLAEADGNRWAMIPLIGLPVAIAVFSIFLLPVLKKISYWIVEPLAVIAAVVATIMLVPNDTFKNDALIAEVDARASSPVDADALDGDWPAYGAMRGSVRFLSLDSINPDNVIDLEVDWTYKTGDLPPKFGSEVTPLEVGDAVYLCSAMNVVIALDPATGKEKWRFEPRLSEDSIPYTAACRGVSYFKNGKYTCV